MEKEERLKRIKSFCRVMDNSEIDLLIKRKEWSIIRNAKTNEIVKEF